LVVLSIVWACATAPAVPYTLDVSPLALLPAAGAGIDDQRGRFREILCAVDEAHGHELPEYRPCDEILHRFTDEPAGEGEPVHLGPARSKLRVAAGRTGRGMFRWLGERLQFALEHLQGLGYQTASIRGDGLSSSTNNGRQIRRRGRGDDRRPTSGWCWSATRRARPTSSRPATYPELARRVAAVVSVAGAVNGSPLADDAPESLLTLLEYLPGSKCGAGDGGALESLRPATRRDFASAHELPETVRYYSVASFAEREQISFGLRGSYDELAKMDPRNDSQMLFYDQIIAGGALPRLRQRRSLGGRTHLACAAFAATVINATSSRGDSTGGDHPVRRGTTLAVHRSAESRETSAARLGVSTPDDAELSARSIAHLDGTAGRD
jgi:hypothetical protein